MGGAIAGLALDTESDTSLYWAAVVCALVVAVICAVAAHHVWDERADSVTSIKEDIDEMLAFYPEL